MKKYKLKKDFPGSKIGDVWVKADSGFMSPEDRETIKMHEHLFKPFYDWFEDYQEPKVYYYISDFGAIRECEIGKFPEDEEDRKAIGNYFETKEEAEKAVEKLKAWKWLKDEGFKFQFWTSSYSGDNIAFFINWINADSKKKIEDNLDLLFGGEE